ncbi:MAG: AAA family ATPase [Burkholderiales bacterium RIFOXYC12_FULL_60_6]|nr:MAG: AAA family ATPase [Burkholderiales bacterium RIFOXYC12_FULL_60_6]
MLIQHTMTQLKSLKLDGMARALEEQQIMPASQELTFEDRLSLLVEREITWRDNRRLARLLRQAKLRQAQACMEDIDYRGSRNLDKRLMVSLAGGDWIRRSQNLLLTGSTGCGKTWLACALGNQACRQGFSVMYVRVPRLVEQLRIAHGDGSFGKLLAQLAKIDVLLLDDWGLTPLQSSERHDLLEVVDDRVNTRSTIITSQLPVDHWHAWLNDPTLADAILDRLVHASHRIALKGESLRKNSLESTFADAIVTD